MTAINITAITVLDNPTLFVNPFQFEIQYECIQDLQHGEHFATAALLCVFWQCWRAGRAYCINLSRWVTAYAQRTVHFEAGAKVWAGAMRQRGVVLRGYLGF